MCTFRSQNVKVFVALMRNHSSNSELRRIIDFQTTLVRFTINHLYSLQQVWHESGISQQRLKDSTRGIWASNRNGFCMPYKISRSWIDKFHALALDRSSQADEVIGHGLSFNKLIIMWKRVVASLGRGLEQCAEERSDWNRAEYMPKL